MGDMIHLPASYRKPLREIPACAGMTEPARAAGDGSMPGMTADELERKALRIQTVVEEHTLQEHGMVPMFVRDRD